MEAKNTYVVVIEIGPDEWHTYRDVVGTFTHQEDAECCQRILNRVFNDGRMRRDPHEDLAQLGERWGFLFDEGVWPQAEATIICVPLDR